MPGSVQLLLRPDVRKELELLDDQVKQLEQAGERLRGQMRERFREAMESSQDMSRETRGEKIREIVQEVGAEIEDRIGEILLPPQLQRLRQLELQMRLRGGLVRALTSEQVADELEITEDQQARLRTKAQQVEEELREKIAELRKQAQDELLQVLTPEQRAEWRERIGDPFEFQRMEPPRRGFGPAAKTNPGRGGPRRRPKR
jgi:vacuolar-type H+-ATPase subunit I/STV1